MRELSIVDGSQLDHAGKTNQSLAQSFMSAEIIVVLDNSISMIERDAPDGMSREDYAASQLTTLQGQYPGQIALICFANRVEYSPSGTVLDVGDSTDMHEALSFVQIADNCDMKIIIVSDGEANEPEAALQKAREFVTKIDVLYCGPKNDTYGGCTFLRELAGVTGGQFFVSEEPGMLGDSINKLLLEEGRNE